MAMSQLYEDPIFGDSFKIVHRYRRHFLTILISAFLSVFAYISYLSSIQDYNAMVMNYYIQYLDACESHDVTTETETLSLLQNKYGTHLYTTLASLSHSAKLMNNKEMALAKKELNWVLSHSSVGFFKDLAHYRTAEIAKNEREDKELRYHINAIQTPELKNLAQHILATALAEDGLLEESRNLYKTLIEGCDDPVYQALLTSEYHITTLLDS